MKRLFATWTVCLCLAACVGRAPAPASPTTEVPPRDLFFKGLTELQKADTSPSLAALAGRSEPGPWRDRAKVLLDWQERLRSQEGAARSNLQQELRRCREGREKLSAENASLNHDLQELKRIMVEMEKRSK